MALLQGDDGVAGVRVRHQGRLVDLRSKAVILACGGFEANAEMRARYLGPGWDLAKVRGTHYNTGQGLKMALDIGAAPAGHWSGAMPAPGTSTRRRSATSMSATASRSTATRSASSSTRKGKRFLDEGLDFHCYTYAKYGGEILKQPGLFAWQVFDQKTLHLLRDEYRIPRTTKEKADTLGGAGRASWKGSTPRAFSTPMRAFNAAPRPDVPFNPNIHDGLRTAGLAIDKTQLGAEARHPALRGLWGDGRHHLHLRRAQDHRTTPRSRTPPAQRSPASSPPARSSAGSTTTTTPAAPG